jgi:hypothetical protein
LIWIPRGAVHRLPAWNGLCSSLGSLAVKSCWIDANLGIQPIASYRIPIPAVRFLPSVTWFRYAPWWDGHVTNSGSSCTSDVRNSPVSAVTGVIKLSIQFGSWFHLRGLLASRHCGRSSWTPVIFIDCWKHVHIRGNVTLSSDIQLWFWLAYSTVAFSSEEYVLRSWNRPSWTCLHCSSDLTYFTWAHVSFIATFTSSFLYSYIHFEIKT